MKTILTTNRKLRILEAFQGPTEPSEFVYILHDIDSVKHPFGLILFFRDTNYTVLNQITIPWSLIIDVEEQFYENMEMPL